MQPSDGGVRWEPDARSAGDAHAHTGGLEGTPDLGTRPEGRRSSSRRARVESTHAPNAVTPDDRVRHFAERQELSYRDGGWALLPVRLEDRNPEGQKCPSSGSISSCRSSNATFGCCKRKIHHPVLQSHFAQVSVDATISAPRAWFDRLWLFSLVPAQSPPSLGGAIRVSFGMPRKCTIRSVR